MSGPNEPGGESTEDEPTREVTGDTGVEQNPVTDSTTSEAYSAPESEQFISGPYVPVDPALYDYDDYEPGAEEDEIVPAPRWPWIVGIVAILAAIALVTSVTLLVLPTLTSNVAAPSSTTTTPPPSPFQDQKTTTTTPPPPPTPTTTEVPTPPPPSTETVTVTTQPPPPPPPAETPPPQPAPSTVTTTTPPPATTTTTAPAGPRKVTYTVTGTKAPGDIISITYTDSSGHSRTQHNVYIPWSFTVTPISQSEIGSVQASSLLRVSRLNCSIVASDGTVLSQMSDNSPTTNC